MEALVVEGHTRDRAPAQPVHILRVQPCDTQHLHQPAMLLLDATTVAEVVARNHTLTASRTPLYCSTQCTLSPRTQQARMPLDMP